MIARLRPAVLLFLLATLATPVPGSEAGEYWVLGSYSVEAGARSEQVRLGAALSAEVLIARYERAGAPLFRVIVSTAVPRDVLLAAAVEPWSMRVDATRIIDEARRGSARVTEARARTQLPDDIARDLPGPAPVEPADGIALGETWADHCEASPVNQRDAACDSAAYKDVKAARARLESSANALRRYCRQAVHAAQPACRTVK